MGKLLDQHKIEIVEKYQSGEYTCAQLGKEYGVTGDSIAKMLKRRNILVTPKIYRKYSLNEHFFDIIDTEEKAYFLGFLYADGCNNTKMNRISIELQQSDVEILEKFNLAINSNRPLMFRPHTTLNSQNTIIARINNQHMSSVLYDLGCVDRKSLVLKFPTENQVPNNLLRHWLRGLWDGDGNYNLYKTSGSASLTGTIYVCQSIQDYLLKELNISTCIYSCGDNGITSIIKIGGNKQFLKFLNFIYSDSSIYLSRKFEKVIQITDKLLHFNKLYTRNFHIDRSQSF